MKVSLIAWQVIMPAIWLFLVYRFIVKPWRAERKIGVDGLFIIAGTTIVFQDGMSNWSAQWITYNSYLVNWGSWYNDVPGWMAFEDGKMVLEPPLFIPFAHGFAWLAFAMIGRKVINAVRARRPDVGIPALLVITFCLTFMLDVILEGVIWMPFGVYTYVGGHWPLLFPDAYHMFPLNEAIFIGTWSTLVVFLYVPKRQGPDAGRAGHRPGQGRAGEEGRPPDPGVDRDLPDRPRRPLHGPAGGLVRLQAERVAEGRAGALLSGRQHLRSRGGLGLPQSERPAQPRRRAGPGGLGSGPGTSRRTITEGTPGRLPRRSRSPTRRRVRSTGRSSRIGDFETIS